MGVPLEDTAYLHLITWLGAFGVYLFIMLLIEFFIKGAKTKERRG